MLYALYQYAEERNITIYRFPMRTVSAAAFADNTVIMDVAKIENTADELVRLAHEIGHIETISFYRADAPLITRGKLEARASRWAIRKLLPRENLKAAVKSGLTATYELAEHFGVTEDFIRQAIAYYRVVR